MATALPRNNQLRLEQVLAQWQHWAGAVPERPRLERELGPGLSNFSYLVSCGDRQWVIRLDGIQPATNGIHRQTEWRALHHAHERGIAPHPRYFNPDIGALVCDYLPPDPAPPCSLPDIAELLQSIHNLPPMRHRLDLRERIVRYEHLCASRAPVRHSELAAIKPALRNITEQCHHDTQPPVLCHNDLLAANRIYSGGRLWALDWEYCAMGSPWFDLAALCCGDELPASQCDELLYLYLGGQPLVSEEAGFAGYRVLYRYLELLWHGSLSPESVDWPAKLAALVTDINRI